MKRISVFCSLALISLALVFLVIACGGGEENPFGVKSELVAEADNPAAIAFAPDGRLFYAERLTGNIRVITPDGQLQEEPFTQVDVAGASGWGASGLAVDPDFETNRYVYVIFTRVVKSTRPITGTPTVMRFTDANSLGTDPKLIVDDLPETDPSHHFNANGSIHFGPDGDLYFTVGDYDLGPESRFPQDLSMAQGKMFRVDKGDGSAPPGNPFADDAAADPRIFAYGFLRAFDFAFHPETGQIYGTDNTVSCEELNVVLPGSNYGWADVGKFPFSDCLAGAQEPAIHFLAEEGFEPGDFLSSVNVSGLEFVSGDVYPLIGDGLLVCESEPKLMRRLVLTGPDFDQVTNEDVIVDDCAFDIAVSPDGVVYYSNTREIRRLVPVGEQQPE